MLVGDPDPAAHRERLVGGRHGVGVHVFTIRGDAVVVDRSDSLQPAIVVGIHQMQFSVLVKIRQLGGCGRSDLNSCREHARERCCESGSLDGTTTLRVLISQTDFLFVCFTCRSDMPIGEKAKGEPLTMTSAWQCRDDFTLTSGAGLFHYQCVFILVIICQFQGILLDLWPQLEWAATGQLRHTTGDPEDRGALTSHAAKAASPLRLVALSAGAGRSSGAFARPASYFPAQN